MFYITQYTCLTVFSVILYLNLSVSCTIHLYIRVMLLLVIRYRHFLLTYLLLSVVCLLRYLYRFAAVIYISLTLQLQ